MLLFVKEYSGLEVGEGLRAGNVSAYPRSLQGPSGTALGPIG